MPTHVLDTIQHQLEIVYRELATLELLGNLDNGRAAALQLTGSAIGEVQELLQSSPASSAVVCSSSPVHDGSVGRPRYDIPMSTLEFLVVDCGFSVPQVSAVSCVSIRTIRRRMSEYGMSAQARYSTLTDQQLDDVVCGIQHEFPVCGNRQMIGHLRAKD